MKADVARQKIFSTFPSSGISLEGNSGRRAPGHAGRISWLEGLAQHALDREQPALDVEPTGVAAEAATGMQHTVAWHDDRQGVRSERRTGGAERWPRRSLRPPRRAATAGRYAKDSWSG